MNTTADSMSQNFMQVFQQLTLKANPCYQQQKSCYFRMWHTCHSESATQQQDRIYLPSTLASVTRPFQPTKADELIGSGTEGSEEKEAQSRGHPATDHSTLIGQ